MPLHTFRPAFRCPRRYLVGGEPTVHVADHDKAALGGRSQHGALQTALLIGGYTDMVVLAGGTDGGDGPTDAAGAVVDGETIANAKKHGLRRRRFPRAV